MYYIVIDLLNLHDIGHASIVEIKLRNVFINSNV